MCFVGGKGYELASSTPGLNCTLLYRGRGDVKGYATWLKTYPTLSQTIVSMCCILWFGLRTQLVYNLRGFIYQYSHSGALYP